MTKTEMTELFAVMSLAWPNAEMFKNGVGKLGPTIALWTSCLSDLDFGTAKKAIVRLGVACKFPPTIAELRTAADEVIAEMRDEAYRSYSMVRNAVTLIGATGQTLDGIYETLPIRSRKVIDAIGGMEAFVQPDKPMFNMTGFIGTYEQLLKSNLAKMNSSASSMKRLSE